MPSQPRLRAFLLHSCAVTLLAGCGSDAPAGPSESGEVTVFTILDREPASPGQTITVTVRAQPLGSARVRWIAIAIIGLVEKRDSVAFLTDGPQQLTTSFRVPVVGSGSVIITGSASAGSGVVTSQKVLEVVDVEPPVIVSFDATPRPSAAPGDVIRFAFTARDTVGVKRVLLTFDNSFAGSDSVVFGTPKVVATDTINVPVPSSAALGFPVMATLTAFDAAGLSAEKKFNVQIVDNRPPASQLELGGLRSDNTIGTGQPLDLIVTSTDNHSLKYIGFDGGGLRDSVLATGATGSHTFRITVPTSWLQTRPVVTSWARDVSGNASSVNGAKEIRAFDWANPPMQTTALSNDFSPIQVLWDAKRSVVYLLNTNAQIEVVHVPSGARGAPITLPVSPHSFALTNSGDSLVVTLPGARALGVIDLRAAVRSTVIVPLQIATEDSELLGPFTRSPEAVQVSGSHVFVALVHGLFVARLLDVNLATGTQVIRSDLAGSADVAQRPSFFRLDDGRLLLVRDGEGSYPQDHFVYAPGADSFTKTTRIRPAGRYQFYAAPSGHFLLRGTVLNSAFDSVTTLATRDWKEDYGLVAALSPDASVAYTGTFYGYQKVRVSDGFVLEQVNLGWFAPQFLYALPDGSRLIVVGMLPGTNKGDWAVMIVDLR